MAYKIAYENGGKVRYFTERCRKSTKGWIVASCAIIMTAVMLYAGAGKYLRSFFMPGVTDAAFASLTEDIRNGESISDAVTAFCAGVIENAKTAN